MQEILSDHPLLGVLVYRDERLVWANPTVATLCGLSVDELLGFKPGDATGLIHPDDREEVRNRARQRLAGETIEPVVRYRIVRPDGTCRWVEAVNLVAEMDGKPSVIVTMRDVTEQVESQERYRLLVESISDYVLQLDEDLNILFANAAVPGLTVEEIKGRGILSFLPEDDQARVEGILRRVLETGRTARYETTVEFSGRDIIHFETLAAPLRVHDGTHLILNSRDITDRKRLENGLAESAIQWQSTFDAISDPICLMDREQRFLRANRAMLNLVGEKEELTGRHCYEVVHGATKPPEGCPFLRMKQTLNRESHVWSIDGRSYETHVEPILDDEGRLTSAVQVMSDLTDRLANERDLRQSEERYRQLLDGMFSCVAVYEAVDDGDDFVFLDMNPAGLKSSDLAKEAVVGHRVTEVFPGVEEMGILAAFRDVWRSGRSQHLPMRQYKDNRLSIWVDNFIYKLPGGQVVAIYEDVTEFRRAQERLRFLGSIGEQVTDSIIVTDCDYRITFINQAAEMMFGFSLEDLRGQTPDLLNAEPLADEIQKEIYRTVTSGASFHGEILNRRKDGSTFQCEFTVSAIRSASGTIDGFIGVQRDVSERRRMIEALEATRNLHEEAQSVAHIGHWELVPAIGTPVWSDEVFRIFGLDPKTGEPSFAAHKDIIHPDDWPALNEAVKRAGQEGIPFDLTFRFLRPDEKTGWMHAIGKVEKDSDGEIRRLFGTAQDVTEQNQAEARLRRSEADLREAQRMARIGNWHVDLASGKVTWSEGLYRILQIEPDEELNLAEIMERVTHPDDLEMANRTIRDAMETGVLAPSVFRVIRSDGEVRVLTSEGRLTKDDQGRPFALVGVNQDITERMQADAALRDSKERIRRLASRTGMLLENERKNIARRVHDELGQILSALKMDVDGLKLDIPHAASKIAERLDRLGRDTDRGIGIAQAISRQLRPGILDTLGLIPALQSEMEEFTRRSGIEGAFRSDRDRLDLDEHMKVAVFRIFQEILTNVIRHAKAHHVEVSLAVDRQVLVLAVLDDGTGIDAAKIDDRDSLGIMGMKERIAPLDGTLGFETPGDGGTLVTLRVPLGSRMRPRPGGGR